jgi:hypothetical protein
VVVGRRHRAADVLSIVPVDGDLDDGAKSGRTRLLAVRRVWRGLECLTARRIENRCARVAVSAAQLARDLEELIAALDRRLPGVTQAGEIGIARDAALLRAHAVKRLEELNQRALAGEIA